MTAPLDALRRSLDVTGNLIDQITDGEWSNATPCAQWNLRDLVEHVLGSLDRFATALGAAPESLSGSSAAEAYRRLAECVNRAFAAPDALEREVSVPIGTVPAAMALQLLTVEVITHGWDIAQAVGSRACFEEADVEASIAFSRGALSQIPPERRPFEATQQVSADAPATDRLAALLGRRVPEGH